MLEVKILDDFVVIECTCNSQNDINLLREFKSICNKLQIEVKMLRINNTSFMYLVPKDKIEALKVEIKEYNDLRKAYDTVTYGDQ